jgi:hypothetical protein
MATAMAMAMAIAIPLSARYSGKLPDTFHDRVSMFSSPAALFGSLLFGAIGFGAFIYGKRMVLYRPMAIGLALMAYPYLVSQTWLLYAVGCALCVGLLVLRD